MEMKRKKHIMNSHRIHNILNLMNNKTNKQQTILLLGETIPPLTGKFNKLIIFLY
jgi:hypothetical protein